jgi:hypothetical protein
VLGAALVDLELEVEVDFEVEVEVEVEVAEPPAAGVAGWLANPIFRSKDGVLLPQPWAEPPEAEPLEVEPLAGEPAPDSCLVELLSETLLTPSIRRKRDISLATSGWVLVQPVSSIVVPAGAAAAVAVAVLPVTATAVTAVPFRVASEVFFGTTCEICASVACQSKRVLAS